MPMNTELVIREMRRKQQNPYAHLDELEEWREIHAARLKLENPYAHSEDLEGSSRDILQCKQSAQINDSSEQIHIKPLAQCSRSRRSRAAIETLVRRVHRRLWDDRSAHFPADCRPVDMLNPKVALEIFGYSVDTATALGQLLSAIRKVSNVAGLIDKTNRQVLVSSGLSPIVRNYTLAHELGHALMHEFHGMHRDKPLDGTSASNDPQEREAEIFASLFLMPAKLMRSEFERIFGSAPFELNEETRFALAGFVPNGNWQPNSLRDLSRILSRATRFNGVDIVPFAAQFHVSVEAMAIRLEELQLLVSN